MFKALTASITFCFLFFYSPAFVVAQEDPDTPSFIDDSVEEEEEELSPGQIRRMERQQRREQREKELAQERKAEKASRIPYEDRIYDDKIKSVMIYKKGLQLNPPIIQLGGMEKIEVRFDDHHPHQRNFAYSIEHCTHDWQPSNLIESEYIEGFFNHFINDYSNSFNTMHRYTHHTFEFPHRDLRITLSGNYLLKVYAEDDPEKIIFTRRFMVYENRVGIEGKAVAPRHVPLRQEGQEIQFSIQHGAFAIPNPYRDVHVKLVQNQQWDRAITDLKPVFIKSGELVYDYDAPATFMAGNEYRFLDLKSFTYNMENILKTERTPNGFEVLLVPDEKRVFKRYLTISDINGQYFIKNDDGFEDFTESDYARVHFTLKMDIPLMGSDIYIYGGFNGFECKEENRMTYDADMEAYRGSLLLKQGFYNYKYAVVEPGSNIPDITLLEGSFMETENEYAILVYYRDFSNNYDQLIGVSYVYANKR